MRIILLIFVFGLWSLGIYQLAAYMAWGQTFIREISYAPQKRYGPFPLPEDEKEVLDFGLAPRTFGEAPVKRLDELSWEQFEGMLLSTIPQKLKKSVREVTPSALKYAQAYQIDPFWILAIMWAESCFRPQAKSPVQANGLMQIMPRTSYYVTQKMGLSVGRKLAYRLTGEPQMNIMMGVYYLDYLLQQHFRGNLLLATVAYNMGPGWVYRRLRYRLPIGNKNRYLSKVQHYYSVLVQPFRRYFEKRPFPYEGTYVVRERFVDRQWEREMIRVLDPYFPLAPRPSSATVDQVNLVNFKLLDNGSEETFYPRAKLL